MEWIKCSDRLPEEQVPVLGYSKKEAEVFDLRWNGNHWQGVGLSVAYWGDGDAVSFTPNDITHWMPLPEGPSDE